MVYSIWTFVVHNNLFACCWQWPFASMTPTSVAHNTVENINKVTEADTHKRIFIIIFSWMNMLGFD